MIKPLTKRVLICASLLLYLSGYISARVSRELIHRHTWDSRWSRHWIVPAGTDGAAHLAFLAMLLSDIPASQDDLPQTLKAIDRIDRRRRLLQYIFVPLIAGESAMQWILSPRE